MSLEQAKRSWDRLGKIDPLWAILTQPGKDGNRWGVREFFRTGQQHVAEHLAHLTRLGIHVAHGRCLDFGCGVGRVTQALCDHFEECHGVDIAPSMIEWARRFNRHGNRCQYHINDAPDLRLFPDASFDLVISLLVLQHIEPVHAKRYIREFVRVVKPGGAIVFQVPAAFHPRATEPLSEGAFQARIQPVDAPARITAANTLPIRVLVRNAGDALWSRRHGVRLGNHWRKDGQLFMLDDGRKDIGRDLAPGEEVELDIVVTAPPDGGHYELELDMVQEGVTWFADHRSPTARISVRVAHERLFKRLSPRFPADSGEAASSGAQLMEMHSIPRGEVTEVVSTAGGELVDASPFEVCGDEFDSFRYVAIRQ